MSASNDGRVDLEVDRTSVSTDPREAESSNLVARLRAWNGNSFGPYRSPVSDLLEAADEIERLNKLVSEHCQAAFQMGAAWGTQSKEIERLREALELACPEDPFDGGDLPCRFCGVDPGSVFHKSNCAWTRGRAALRGTAETSPVLPCDKCGRGIDEHVGIGMPCPETTKANEVKP